jgi:hypothetical protein
MVDKVNALVELRENQLTTERPIINLVLLTKSRLRHSLAGFGVPLLALGCLWILIRICRIM